MQTNPVALPVKDELAIRVSTSARTRRAGEFPLSSAATVGRSTPSPSWRIAEASAPSFVVNPSRAKRTAAAARIRPGPVLLEITLRPPRPTDARELWRLVTESQGLELNSGYAYLLLCTHFAATGVVAERGGSVVGFVVGYRPPSHPEAVFVWQIGVDRRAQGRGVGSRLLRALLRRDGCRGVCFLEATVTPSNRASAALFRSLARDLGCACEESEMLPADLFPGAGHEAEVLFRIGPFSSSEGAASGEGKEGGR